MSLRERFGPGGKDLVIFATKEDHSTPSTIKLPEAEPSPGLILPNGDINWNCPCLGGMATGPCGVQFREAFSCFHYSESEPKGSDCYNAFSIMQKCMSEFPTIYNKDSTGNDDEMNSFTDMNNAEGPDSSKENSANVSGEKTAK